MAARLRLCLILPLVVALPAQAGDGVYKWVDENGRSHFSSSPPPGAKANRLELRPSTPDPVNPSPAKTWQDKLQDSNLRQQQEQKQAADAAKKEREAEQRCGAARRSLDTLKRQQPVYRVNAQGEREYLEDSQRQAAIDAAQERVNASCR